MYLREIFNNICTLKKFFDMTTYPALIPSTKIFRDAKTAICQLPAWERGFVVFWLIGPFLLLVERSPADVWISITALTFLIRAVIKKDYRWTKPFWVKSSLVFWLVCIVSGLNSSLPLISTGEAIAWFRFPLFAIASVFWLGRDKRILYAMMLITFMALLVMCFILSAELLIEGQKKGRLLWPYGDTVSGNFITKVGAPIFFVLVACSLSQKLYFKNVCAPIVFFILFISIMTGERINTLILFCGAILTALFSKTETKRLLLGLALVFTVACAMYANHAQNFAHYFLSFKEQLPLADHSAYYRAMIPGILAFTAEPILGIGTGNMRHLCWEVIEFHKNLDCHPHPHNFYVQLAAETGLFGLVTGSCFFCSIIYKCFRASMKFRDSPLLSIIWIVPFGFFWPIASFPDLFGQWNNSFMWASLSLVLCIENIKETLTNQKFTEINPQSQKQNQDINTKLQITKNNNAKAEPNSVKSNQDF